MPAGILALAAAMAITPHGAAAAGASPDSLAHQLVLVGIVLGHSDGPIAVIEDASSKSTAFYHVGDPIQGAVLRTVVSDRVVLSAGDREIELRLAASRASNGLSSATPPRQVPSFRAPVRARARIR